MKAQELRIGNYFGWDIDNSIHKLHHIGEGVNTMLFWCEKPDGKVDGYVNDCDAVAIPLTEEWLVKFGFEGQSQNRGDWWETYKFGKLSLNLNKKTKVVHCHDAFVNPKHVHQLQNLYFALTGEELVLKP